MAAPTFKSFIQSAWNSGTSPRTTTSSTSWNIGDLVIVLGVMSDNSTFTMSTPTSSGSGLSFTLLTGLPTNTASNCKVYAWVATATATSSGTISAVCSAGTSHCGIAVWVYSGSDGAGNNQTNVGEAVTTPGVAAGSTGLTRAQANSAVVWAAGDWSAVNDTTVTASPSTGATQRVATFDTGQYTVLAFDWTDQGATGTTKYGVTAAGNGKWTGVAVEIKGTGSSARLSRLTLLGAG